MKLPSLDHRWFVVRTKPNTEHLAADELRVAGKPYAMPSEVGTDFNDMHLRAGVFAVQKHLATFIRSSLR
jgi:hypothetical protein